MPKKDNSNTPVRSADSGVTIHRGGSVQQASPPDESYTTLNSTSHDDTAIETHASALVTEMRLFREELAATRHQMAALNETMFKLTSRMDACENRVSKLDERMEALERRIDKNSSGADNSLLATIEQLKAELNERDQDLFQNDIEISCVPEQKGENVQHTIITLANKLGVNLGEQEIVSATRVGRPLEETGAAGVSATSSVRPRLIVVRLARRTVRDQLLQAARVRRGATTEGAGLPGPPRRFYVNERLTRTNRILFRKAREAAGRLNWRYVWSRDGRVFTRQHQGSDAPRHRLRTEADISRVFGFESISSTGGNTM